MGVPADTRDRAAATNPVERTGAPRSKSFAAPRRARCSSTNYCQRAISRTCRVFPGEWRRKRNGPVSGQTPLTLRYRKHSPLYPKYNHAQAPYTHNRRDPLICNRHLISPVSPRDTFNGHLPTQLHHRLGYHRPCKYSLGTANTAGRSSRLITGGRRYVA